MVKLTRSAARRLRTLIVRHPEDCVVRLAVRDVDEARVGLSITLEPKPREGDEVQDCEGLTVAVEERSAARMDGITVDYAEPGGFSFAHPDHGDDDPLRIVSMN